MVRHVVMFKLKAFDDLSEKQARMYQIKDALEALMNVIDVIRSIRVDFNINDSEKWDLILTADFDSLDDVEAYSSHPAHVEAGTAFIAPVRADRACVDYIIE